LGTREEILKAADKRFGEIGFDAASIREIAEVCGVNKALIHYHFKNKEALFESVLDNYYEKLNRTFQKTLLKPEGNLRRHIMQAIEIYVDFLARNRNFSRMVQREASGGKHMARIVTHMMPLFEMGTAVIQENFPGTRSGELAAPHLLSSFYGMIVAYFTYGDILKHLLKSNPFSKANLTERKAHLKKMVDLVLDAVQENGHPTAEK